MHTKSAKKRLLSRAALLINATALCLSAAPAMAAVVCSSPALSVPANLDGVYLNIVTGANGSTSSGVSGWDINLYQTTSALYFFWPTTPANSFGGVATGTVYDALTAGATVSAAQTYSVASGGGGPTNYVNWQTTTTGRYLGVRFFNEATSAINYGYLQMDTGATNGYPATINQICYENTGAAIAAGAGSDSAPTLTYSPTTAAGVSFPAGAAGSVNSTITVSAAGAVGAGSSAVTGCSISGAGAASFGAVTTTPANGVFNSSTTAGSINLSCTRGTAAATATLACTETATPTVAGSPFTRSWNLTCPAAPAVLAPTTIPSLGTVSLWMMVLSFLGLGMLFATRARS